MLKVKVNCLLKNTVAVPHIRDAIKMIVGDRMETIGEATFPGVFNDLRKAGLEIDAESAGAIYNGLYGAIQDDAVSTPEQVNDYAGSNFQRQLDAIVDEINEETDTPAQAQLGILSPERHAANAISKMFQKFTYGTTERTSSALKKMQDLVTKAATSLLKKEDKPGQTLTGALNDFFDVDANEFRRLDGQVNTMETLHKAVKEQVKNYVDQVAIKLDDDAAEILREQWDKYTEAFINSTYDIVLGKGDQNSLVNEALKQIQIDGVNVVDVNNNVKWNALIEHNDPDTIAENVKQLFKDGFTDKDGTVVSYTDRQADRIGNYFKRIYEQKLYEQKKRALQNNRVKNRSAKNIISDFIKDRGFLNLKKDKSGSLLLEETDWDNAMKFIQKQIGKTEVSKDKLGNQIRGMDLVQNKLRVFLNSQKNADGTPKFNDYQKNVIIKEFVDTVIAKLDPGTGDPTSIDRLIALNDLNQSRAFEAETQQAINKVVGVGGLSQKVLTQIQDLTKVAKTIIDGNNLSNTPNPGGVNRGAYAYTALVEIDRKIKEILREHKVDSSTTQLIAKYISDFLGGGTVSLLINPNNVIENINTQLGTNVAETINLFFRNPALAWRSFRKLQGDFWQQWINYAAGGASNEITNESDLSSDIQSSERLRVRAIINEYKGKDPIKATISVVAKSPMYAISIASRIIMNSFDAATTTSIMRKRMIQSTYNSLLNQGNSSEQVMAAMDKAFNIPQNIKDEIEVENKRITEILRSAGFPVNMAMMGQNARDMRLSIYEDIIRDAAVDAGATVKQATEVTKALIESSQSQAKALGGKKNMPSRDIFSLIIYGAAKGLLIPQKALFTATRNAEAQGKLKKAGWLQVAGSAYQNFFGKFVGGVANFMNLAITATPAGFVAAWQLNKQRKELLQQGTNADDIFTATPEEIKQYAELQGLMRSVFVRAATGTVVAAGFWAKALMDNDGDDDEEDTFFNNLMKTKSGRRFIQKHLPMTVALFIAPTYYGSDNDDDKDYPIDRMLQMLGTYTGAEFDTYTNLLKSLKYAKDDASREEVWAKFFGNMVTSYNVNQPEQILKFKDVVESAYSTDEIMDVERNQDRTKELYQAIDGISDGFLINGAIEAAMRLFNPDEKFNRFK